MAFLYARKIIFREEELAMHGDVTVADGQSKLRGRSRRKLQAHVMEIADGTEVYVLDVATGDGAAFVSLTGRLSFR
jgi:hypothetical protein